MSPVSSSLRAVFMGTPSFAVVSLDALLTAGVRLQAVYTQADKPAGRGRALAPPPVKIRALDAGLRIHQPATLRAPEVLEDLKALAPDVIVVAAYGKLLPQDVLDIPCLGCVNVHASLLPRHRGASPIAHAIWAGDETVGVSLMRMEAGLDTGPVYAARGIPMPGGATTGLLTPVLARLGAGLLLETLEGLEKGTAAPKAQDDSLATLAPRLKADQGKLDFSLTAPQLERQIRAFDPWPGTYFEFHGERIKVLSSAVGSLSPEGSSPGDVMSGPGLTVACGSGTTLILRTLQRAGKRPLPSSEVLRGFKIPAGARL